ncbi:MAG: PucR family transcriptional regulator [Solirubrobacterales bacterium]
MLTVGTLLEQLELALVAGERGTGEPIRWVHSTELVDPTRWLSGGELLLTTGLNLTDEARQRELIERLDEAGVCGLGFGTGFDHAEIPPVVIAAADEVDLPVFEVPYEMPFIALTERVATALVNEQYAVLERGIEAHNRLEGVVLSERGLAAVMAAIAEAVGGAALLLDDRGVELIREPQDRSLPNDAAAALGEEVADRSRSGRRSAFVAESGPLAERAIALPVPIEGRGGGGRWLVAAKRKGPVGDFERLLARQAAMVVALELLRSRAVEQTERRLAGDLLAEAIAGHTVPEDVGGRLQPFGVEAPVAMLIFEVEPTPEWVAALERALSEEGVPALVAGNSSGGSAVLCALVSAGERDPVEVAAAARRSLVEEAGPIRAAASRSGPLDGIRRSFHEARCALAATAMANGSAPEVASHRDLGAFTLLLSVQDDDALRAYAGSLLDPITDGEGSYGGELVRSLEAFIENNGQWERAARELYCHRHTLRYRVRRIEELTGRDLSSARDRIEFWLALRAKELVS